MLFKLSLTGVKSRLKDYTVLFSGLAAASMIFYMFLSLATNPQFLKSSGGGLISAQMTTVTFGYGTVLLAILTLVYLFYANGFLLSMRKRDYGMYMMLGAKASKIGQLIFLETLLTGFLATGIGLILGIILTKLVSGLMVAQLGLTLKHFNPLYLPALLWTLAFFTALFFLAALWNAAKLTKTAVIKLLKDDQKPSQIKNRPVLRAIEGIAGLILLAIGYLAMANVEKLVLKALPIALVTIVLGSYFLISATFINIIDFLRKKKKFFYQGMRPFTLGQLKFRLHDYTRILSAISIMFALALGAITVGLNFNSLKDALTDSQYYDAIILNNDQTANKQIEKLGGKAQASYTYKYDSNNARIYLLKAEVEQNPLKTKRYIKNLSSKKSESRTQSGLYKTVTVKADQLTEKAAKQGLMASYIAAQLFSQTASSAVALDSAAFAEIKAQSQTVTFYKVNNFAQKAQALLKITQKQEKRYKEGSNEYLLLEMTKPVSYQLVASMCSGFEFMGFFLGLAFLMMLASTLMFKVLSGAASDKLRYGMLHKIGAQARVLKASLRKEIGVLFLAPALLGAIDVLFGLQFFKLLLPNPYSQIWIPFVIFFILYSVYYLITVKLYEGLVIED